jgi:hypothetical protein
MAVKTYLVEYDPVGGDPDGYYVHLTTQDARKLRAIFRSLSLENMLREWRVDDVESLAVSFEEFYEEIKDLIDRRPGKPKDWFPGA